MADQNPSGMYVKGEVRGKSFSRNNNPICQVEMISDNRATLYNVYVKSDAQKKGDIVTLSVRPLIIDGHFIGFSEV